MSGWQDKAFKIRGLFEGARVALFELSEVAARREATSTNGGECGLRTAHGERNGMSEGGWGGGIWNARGKRNPLEKARVLGCGKFAAYPETTELGPQIASWRPESWRPLSHTHTERGPCKNRPTTAYFLKQKIDAVSTNKPRLVGRKKRRWGLPSGPLMGPSAGLFGPLLGPLGSALARAIILHLPCSMRSPVRA